MTGPANFELQLTKALVVTGLVGVRGPAVVLADGLNEALAAELVVR